MHFNTENLPSVSRSIPLQVSAKPCSKPHWIREASFARLRRAIASICLGGVLGTVLAFCPARVSAQVPTAQTPPHLAPGTEPWGSPDSALRKMAERMAKQRNTERQKKIVADTARLLAMAQKLNDEVSHSNKNELSITVVNQAAEIEKLAKSIKEKMRNGY